MADRKIWECHGLTDLPRIAGEIITWVGDFPTVWLLEGEMGAGKTTLTAAICKALGVVDTVTSPTFALVNEYATQKGDTLYHFDFYRIKDESEAVDIGIDEYFYSGSLCLVEWPSLIPLLIPEQRIEIHIAADPSGIRTIELTRHE
jgi:tRNA threonylcarbamoyladenosine biosynthesis protein TsaE